MGFLLFTRCLQKEAISTARRRLLLVLACWLCCGLTAFAQIPPPQVAIAPQDGGGFLVTTPVYAARINPDGNLHSLQINGLEFLDDRVTGSTGMSYFVNRPLPLPTISVKDTRLIATDGTFTIQYDFNEGFITLTLRHRNPQGAAFIAVCSRQIDYVENMAQAGLAVAPANYDWPDVCVTVPSGEYLELHGGSRIWGRDFGRQVWECSNLAPNNDYSLMLVLGQKAPRTPDLSQLTVLSADINAENNLVNAGQTAELHVTFENNSNEPISAEIATHVESYLGKVLLDERKPLACPPRQSIALAWTVAPADADFYTASWTVDMHGTPKKQSLTFGYNVQAIAPPSQAPPDFADYWTRVNTEAKAADVKLSRLEEGKRCTGTVTVYRIAVQVGEQNCFGWLAVPKFPGRYPGLLLLPGDRQRYLGPNTPLADCGFVVMTIEPTGQTVNGPLQPLITRASMNLEDPAKFALRGVVINYLRAVTALASVPEVDPNRLAVTGVGLGGGMALILGAIDERIQAVAPDVPYYGFIELNRGMDDWPYREVAAELSAHPEGEQAVLQTLRYYDTANFAQLITCPVLMSAGLLDDYSCPTNIYGVYNRLAGPKALRLYPAGHDGGGIRHWEEKIRWLTQVLGKPGPAPTTSSDVVAP